MIEILEELGAASTLLRAALNRYLSACSALKGCRTKINAMNCPPWELSHRVTGELSQVSSYEARIKEARAAISLSRNSCMTIVLINSLPDEILGQIFRLVYNAQPRATDVDDLRRPILNDIDNCSIVCSRWRQVSVSLGSIWSRIDLSLTRWGGLSERCLDRALGYAARASDIPLDVYISDNLETRYNPSTPAVTRTYQFLSSIAPRIRSFTLYLDGYGEPSPSLTNLCTCFSNFTPGVLTHLVLNSQRSADACFLEAAEDLQPLGNQSIEVPRISKRALEDLWLHITVLQSHLLYLPWTSKAYYGLTKLHLTRNGYDASISEQQLIEILKASPQLRIFRFGLDITDSHLTTDPIVPTHLECLEVLVWESTLPDSSQLRTFLRLIAPGFNPLQLSIGGLEQDPTLLDEMKRFFARSNVTKLRVRSGSQCTSTLLDSLPPLELLVLQNVHISSSLLEPHKGNLNPHPAHYPSFQTLYLIHCTCVPRSADLARIFERHSVQAIKFKPAPYPYGPQLTAEQAKELLRTVCPSVELFDRDNPCPLEDWDEPFA